MGQIISCTKYKQAHEYDIYIHNEIDTNDCNECSSSSVNLFLFL